MAGSNIVTLYCMRNYYQELFMGSSIIYSFISLNWSDESQCTYVLTYS